MPGFKGLKSSLQYHLITRNLIKGGNTGLQTFIGKHLPWNKKAAHTLQRHSKVLARSRGRAANVPTLLSKSTMAGNRRRDALAAHLRQQRKAGLPRNVSLAPNMKEIAAMGRVPKVPRSSGGGGVGRRLRSASLGSGKVSSPKPKKALQSGASIYAKAHKTVPSVESAVAGAKTFGQARRRVTHSTVRSFSQAVAGSGTIRERAKAFKKAKRDPMQRGGYEALKQSAQARAVKLLHQRRLGK